ncbi:putative serine/threonine-protein kinase PBL11 [Rosa sericea]
MDSPQSLQDSVPHASHQTHIWGGFVIGILTVMIAALLYFLCSRKLIPALRRRREQGQLSPKKLALKGTLKQEKIDLRRFHLEELVKATNNFNRDCMLGCGAFANVYKGNFDDLGTLAIKRAHADSFQSVEEFRNEVRLLSKVKHRNLVGLVGYCEEPGKKWISLSWRQRVNIAIGAAKGIAHLHEGVNPSIIHRDIKPSNILIGDGFEAKVSDFGLVKSGPVGDDSHVSSQIKGTPGYLDPAYCASFHLSQFSDVYSFGIILLQLVSSRPAVDMTGNRPNFHIIDWARPSLERGRVEEILDANLLSEPCNTEVMLKMGKLGLRCVVKIPKNRPTMSQVCRELEEALYSADNKQQLRESRRSNGAPRRPTDLGFRGSIDYDQSLNSVSLDGIGFQKFHVDLDSMSFQSTSLRCLENNSIEIDIDRDDLKDIREEISTEEDPNMK